MINTGGGRFDPQDRFIYFLASNVERANHGSPMHDYLLVAINELNGEAELATVRAWLDQGKKVFIDSGIFNLTMTHVRNHPGLSMDDALALAPQDIDGFDALFERYVDIVRTYGDQAWGYIELDQGGRENKIKTRTQLESMELRPIPVYHPLHDGWDYFDHLATHYDRICFGNTVQASPAERKRLLATAWTRKQQYPHLWIHVLGLTPNQWFNAYPLDSADSSAWLAAVRWSGYKERADGAPVGELLDGFQYELGSDPTSEQGSIRGTRLAAYGSALQQRNWRAHLRALEQLGCDSLPPTQGDKNS